MSGQLSLVWRMYFELCTLNFELGALNFKSNSD